MAYDAVHDEFISQGAKENYAAQARDIATRDGITPKKAMEGLAKDFSARFKNGDKTSGWEHLAAWAADYDPAEQGLDARQLAYIKAVESAKRDPGVALVGHEAVLKAADEALKAETQTADVSASATAAPAR